MYSYICKYKYIALLYKLFNNATEHLLLGVCVCVSVCMSVCVCVCMFFRNLPKR